MRTARLLLLWALVAAAPPAFADEHEDNILRLTSGQPKAVAAVMRRRMECSRWAGDEPIDLRAYRRAPPRVLAMHCDTLRRDERALRRRYARNASAIAALDQADSYIP
ncbi:MAG TPA: hypothetical protein VFE03_11725 [Caulobacteraceae bacterium]|jgi:hypothetical protein|nr:hypothetical protein [Caulobacteraceae bacterium]